MQFSLLNFIPLCTFAMSFTYALSFQPPAAKAAQFLTVNFVN